MSKFRLSAVALSAGKTFFKPVYNLQISSPISNPSLSTLNRGVSSRLFAAQRSVECRLKRREGRELGIHQKEAAIRKANTEQAVCVYRIR